LGTLIIAERCLPRLAGCYSDCESKTVCWNRVARGGGAGTRDRSGTRARGSARCRSIYADAPKARNGVSWPSTSRQWIGPC